LIRHDAVAFAFFRLPFRFIFAAFTFAPRVRYFVDYFAFIDLFDTDAAMITFIDFLRRCRYRLYDAPRTRCRHATVF